MKKLSFTAQLLTLFIMILLITSLLFSILVVSRLSVVTKSLTYNKLDNYIKITEASWSNGNKIEQFDDGYSVGFIQGSVRMGEGGTEIDYISSNLADIINLDDQRKLLMSLHLSPNQSAQASLSIRDGKTVYYEYKVSQSGRFIIAITNESFAIDMRDNIFIQTIQIFLIVILFAVLILGIWGGAYDSRTRRLRKHISNLPNTSYEESYIDGGRDELGKLSESIETLRLQIKTNEQTKQDMLQNLSHDFKTPIAVIKSYAEAILDEMGSPLENAEIILKQTDLLKNKVLKLLQYNKLEYLSHDKEFEDCHIKDIILNVINTYRFQTNIKIETSLDDSIFKGYTENYYTVIDNIIDNAKRYAKSLIRITLKDKVLKIYNDGEPIDEQFLNGLFKPYEKGSKGQFGLGMSICKKTLDFFNMDLIVNNIESGGVEFTIKERNIVNVYLE